MPSIDDLTIGQVRLLVSQFAPSAQRTEQRTDHGYNIVVLERGFVYIGAVETDDRWVYITHAANIRRWGTTRGLGELVSGPQPNTKLDPAGEVTAPLTALLHLIEVEAAVWETKLS